MRKAGKGSDAGGAPTGGGRQDGKAKRWRPGCGRQVGGAEKYCMREWARSGGKYKGGKKEQDGENMMRYAG